MRAPNLTLRSDPAEERTIDKLLASGWYSASQEPIYGKAADVLVSVRDDARGPIRLGAMLPQMASTSQHETRYGQTECELRGLILGLIVSGVLPRAVAVGDAPDALVTLDDLSVWVEYAEVVDAPSARYTNTMSDLDRDVKDAIDADPAIAAAMYGQHVEFRMSVCPTRSQARLVKRDLLAFLQAHRHTAIAERTFAHINDGALGEVGLTMDRAAWSDTGGSPHIVHVSAGAHTFSPLSLAPIVARRLERKRRLAVGYAVAPLWLVLGVTDIRGTWGASLDLLASCNPDIEPFQRVIVANGPRAIVWTSSETSSRVAANSGSSNGRLTES